MNVNLDVLCKISCIKFGLVDIFMLCKISCTKFGLVDIFMWKKEVVWILHKT